MTDRVVGCTDAATAPAPELGAGGAGGRYGVRGSSERVVERVVEREQLFWSPTDQITAGLAWLTAAQQPDGSFLGDDGRPDLEATALVMLALLAKSTSLYTGEGSEMLNHGIGWILDQQRDDGRFGPNGPDCLRHHALATYALGEAYGLSYCVELRGSLCDAVAWLDAQRQEDGGFANGLRGAPSDAASTASVVMALATTEFFGVKAEAKSREVVAWFDDAAKPDDATTSAAELFCRVFAGQDPKQHKEIFAAAARLPETADPMDPRCLYWTTYCLFQMDRALWKKWLDRLGEIAQQQHAAGALAGSWDPANGESRVVTTALRVLSLQAFYRYARLIR